MSLRECLKRGGLFIPMIATVFGCLLASEARAEETGAVQRPSLFQAFDADIRGGRLVTLEEAAPVDEIDEQLTPLTDVDVMQFQSPLDEDPLAPTRITTPGPPLSPPMIELRDRIRKTLSYYYQFPLNTRDHNPWEAMHTIIAYGVDAEMRRGGPSGQRINAIGWLCYGGACQGHRLLYLDRGRPAARKGVSVQGHHGQFLAILAQSNLQRDYPLKINGRTFTLEDLIETEKLGCRRGDELTFKLIALSHYLDTDASWRNDQGETWSISRLVSEEIAQPIRGAACGGTHRLMGLSYAVAKRYDEGMPIDGEFRRAEKYLRDYHRYTLSMQNRDGSFSTEWFTKRGARPDLDRRLQTTGHILEWLVFSLPEDELRNPQVVRAVSYLTNLMYNSRKQSSWEIGPLGHALHALALYDARVFKAYDEAEAPLVAERPSRSSRPQSIVRPQPMKVDEPPILEEAPATDASDDEADEAEDSSAAEADTVEEDDDVKAPALLAPAPAKPVEAGGKPAVRAAPVGPRLGKP